MCRNSRATICTLLLCCVFTLSLPIGDLQAKDPDASILRDLRVDIGLNQINYTQKNALQSFHSAYADSWVRRLRIIHLGDSHVQPGISTGRLRSELQQRLGDGGYGLMFPYTIANARDPVDYYSEYTGEWQCGLSRRLPPAVPLGVIGMACQTEDKDASFTLRFQIPVSPDWRIVRLFVRRAARPVRLLLISAKHKIRVTIPASSGDGHMPVQVKLPAFDGSLTVRLARRLATDTQFKFYGLSLENIHPGGVIVDMAGVGATRFRAQLNADHLDEQLQALRPNMIILDYGTNEYLYKDLIKPTLMPQIKEVVTRLKNAVPGVSILLTSTQDLAYKGVEVTSGAQFAQMIAHIAQQMQVAWYNWFHISGGSNSILRWTELGFAQSDNVHLTLRGYHLKGWLLAKALLSAVGWSDKGATKKQHRSPLINKYTRKRKVARPSHKLRSRRKKGRKFTYRIKRGDSLSSIASRYRVSVAEIKRWNRLSSSRIFPRQKLTLYRPRGKSRRRKR